MRITRAGVAGLCVLLLVSTAGLAAVADDLRLVDAVRHGRSELARTLIKQHVDVNIAEADGTTPLHWAAERDDRDLVVLLLGSGARVNAVNMYGVTPLSLACRNRNATMVGVLLRAGADPNQAIRTGETPIMTASLAGSADAVKLLLEAGADLNAKEPTAGQTAVMWAAADGHADVVKTLVERGANPHAGSKAGFTPLLFAARNGDIETTRALLAAGVDVNEAAPDGTTALVVATVRSQIAYAEFLLGLGADPDKGPGFTPLHWVVGDWSVKLAGDKTYLRPEGSEFDLLLPLQGQARIDFAGKLLARGADVNARATSTPRVTVGMSGDRRPGGGRVQGATPFWMAAQLANVPMMRFLLAHGADPLIKTARNVSPLMAAAGVDANTSLGYTGVVENDAVEAITLCLERGDDVHTVSTFGENALHGAAYRGNAGSNTIAQLLLDRGIEVNVRNKRRWSPLTIAEGIYTNDSNTRNTDLQRLLIEHGAEPTPPNIERDAYAVIDDDDPAR